MGTIVVSVDRNVQFVLLDMLVLMVLHPQFNVNLDSTRQKVKTHALCVQKAIIVSQEPCNQRFVQVVTTARNSLTLVRCAKQVVSVQSNQLLLKFARMGTTVLTECRHVKFAQLAITVNKDQAPQQSVLWVHTALQGKTVAHCVMLASTVQRELRIKLFVLEDSTVLLVRAFALLVKQDIFAK